MNATINTKPHQREERLWIRYQLDIAALRPALGPLCNAAGRGRRAHTFVLGQQPPQLMAECSMSPTSGVPNGVPDVLGTLSLGSYSGRATSVAAAGTILQTLDTAIQSFARELGLPGCAAMNAGDDIAFSLAKDPVKASTLIWAGANNVRHVDEWATTANAFRNPQTAADRRLRALQEASMAPIAAILGISTPVIENVAYELFQFLTMVSEEQGSYDRVELHALRIGQDLIRRSGLDPAPIGVTVDSVIPREAAIKIPSDRITISDGIGRTASSVEDVGHIFNVRPLSSD